ncbi:hypothetical protein [Paenibacillus sp. NPDC058071]
MAGISGAKALMSNNIDITLRIPTLLAGAISVWRLRETLPLNEK